MSAALALTLSPAFRTVWAIYLLVVLLVVVPVVLVICAQFLKAVTNIRRFAAVTRSAAVSARANTAVVPELAVTLELIQGILEVARSVERHSAEVEKVLGRPISRKRA